MAGLCGWVTDGSETNPSAVLDRMLDHWRGAGDKRCAEGAGWALGVAGLARPDGALYESGRVTAALVGRVAFSESRLESLRGERGAAAALAAAYEETGERCFSTVRGAFAAAVIDRSARTCTLAIDRMGIQSLCYMPVAGGVVFGSTTDSVRANPRATSGINLQSVFNYLYCHMVPGPETVYSGMRRIAPGGYVRLARGEVKVGTYWKMAYREAESPDIPKLEKEFRELLEHSVRNFLNGRRVGAFLSGGTDSSTVAGMLGRVSGAPPKTYSIGFAAEGYDEMAYARIAARHFGTEHHEYYVTPDDVVDLVQRLARFCDQPFGNASAVPTYYCARMAKSDGVEVMLGGDGGDELFGGNERYARQSIFGLYDKLPRLLRRGVLEPVLATIPLGERITPIRKARSYVRQASVPLPRRLHTYNILNRNPLDRVFTEPFLGNVEPTRPGRLFEAIYQSADAQSDLNRMLALDLQFTLADNDLYKVNKMCELAHMEVAYPMLDDDLVAFSAALPTRLKLRGTTLRYFFKRALRDFLPRQILEKPKHGFGLPVGVWMAGHAPLRELAYETVQDFKARGVMRPSFIDEMVAMHQAEQMAYWGGELWVITVLELWLQTHGWARGQALT